MEEINEDLMRFLDADDYEDKLMILREIRGRVDDHVVNMMAASLSVSAGGATREECIEWLMNHYMYLK